MSNVSVFQLFIAKRFKEITIKRLYLKVNGQPQQTELAEIEENVDLLALFIMDGHEFGTNLEKRK